MLGLVSMISYLPHCCDFGPVGRLFFGSSLKSCPQNIRLSNVGATNFTVIYPKTSFISDLTQTPENSFGHSGQTGQNWPKIEPCVCNCPPLPPFPPLVRFDANLVLILPSMHQVQGPFLFWEQARSFVGGPFEMGGNASGRKLRQKLRKCIPRLKWTLLCEGFIV